MSNNFANLVKEKRISLRLTLREFCKKINYDPANWSKIERGLNYPPEDVDTLNLWANNLEINEETERNHFFDLASLSKGKVPKDILADEEALSMLPVFFRTTRGAKPSPEDLKGLVELIKRNN
jgi:transcriptional regulator with XRE-family HTH domain